MMNKIARSIEEIKNEILSLTDDFMQLTNYFEECKRLKSRLDDLIWNISSMRTGLLYRLDNLRREYADLEVHASIRLAQSPVENVEITELGNQIQDLLGKWDELDREIQDYENSLFDLELEQQEIKKDLENIGNILSDVGGDSMGYIPVYSFVKVFKDYDKDRKVVGSFSKEYQKSFLTMDQIKALSDDDLTKLVESLSIELSNIIQKRRMLEKEAEGLKGQESELEKQLANIYWATKKELFETENLIAEIKVKLNERTISYKQLVAYAYTIATEELKKRLEEYEKQLREAAGLREDVRVKITPKKTSGVVSPYFYAEKRIIELKESGCPRKEAWRRVVIWFSESMDLYDLQELFESIYGPISPEGKRKAQVWEKVKGFFKNLVNTAKGFLDTLVGINRQLKYLVES